MVSSSEVQTTGESLGFSIRVQTTEEFLGFSIKVQTTEEFLGFGIKVQTTGESLGFGIKVQTTKESLGSGIKVQTEEFLGVNTSYNYSITQAIQATDPTAFAPHTTKATSLPYTENQQPQHLSFH